MIKKRSFFTRNSFFVFILTFYSVLFIEYVFTTKELAALKIEEELKEQDAVPLLDDSILTMEPLKPKNEVVALTPRKEAVPVIKTASSLTIAPENKKKPITQQHATDHERIVTICNDITQDMVTYKKHWSGHHAPSKFIVKVNDQELKKGVPTPVKVVDDNVRISYSYEFRAMGCVYRTGGRNLEYKIPKKVEQCSSTFSWDAPHNLILEHGQLVAVTDF